MNAIYAGFGSTPTGSQVAVQLVLVTSSSGLMLTNMMMSQFKHHKGQHVLGFHGTKSYASKRGFFTTWISVTFQYQLYPTP